MRRFVASMLDLLFPPRAAEALVREADAESAGRLVAPALRADGVTVLMRYRAPLAKALITEAKFTGSRRAQELLGGILADYLAAVEEERAELGSASLSLVPIPLSAARRAERGYNQAEEICRSACVRLGEESSFILDPSALERTRDTRPQTSLSRDERLTNVTGAFRATCVPGRTYIVIDDVVTTGATMQAACAALKAAGAEEVIPVALAE